MALKSALFICFLLGTVTISWVSASTDVDDGSGITTEEVITDDEDFEMDNPFDSTFDDEEGDEEGSASGDDAEVIPSIKDNMNKKSNTVVTRTDEVPTETQPSTPNTEEPNNPDAGDKKDTSADEEVVIEDKPELSTSHFLAALIVGGCVGLLFAICVIMLLAYRIRKKDEGSYALDEQKKPASPTPYQYKQGQEYYA